MATTKKDESNSLFVDGKDRRGGPIFTLFWTNATGSVKRKKKKKYELVDCNSNDSSAMSYRGCTIP